MDVGKEVILMTENINQLKRRYGKKHNLSLVPLYNP